MYIIYIHFTIKQLSSLWDKDVATNADARNSRRRFAAQKSAESGGLGLRLGRVSQVFLKGSMY